MTEGREAAPTGQAPLASRAVGAAAPAARAQVEADEDLLLRCKTAPQEEVQRIVGELARRHTGAVVGFIHGIVSDSVQAEDLAQEAFVRVYRHARGWEPGAAKFTTWLFTIARNLALNELRDRKRRPALALDAPARDDESGERP